LVVLIAVDGLRADLLDRYDAAFQGGFRRLRDTGLRFEEAWIDHAITVSHAGHVTLATGLLPSHHGIVDAAFYVPSGDSRVLIDAVEDTTEAILGRPDLSGVSPRKVLRDGLSEWIMHADPDARSLAVGSGNVSSLLYTFHAPANVYWYRSGKYVTSTYYSSAYPAWVEQFNSDRLPGYMEASTRWQNSVPASFHHLARADQAAFEGDKVHTTFPHAFEEELADAIAQNPQVALARWFRWTPSLDEATLMLARSGLEAMTLGQRDATDCLSIVLSMVDSNSHYYGPLSLETFDTLMRLDKALGELCRGPLIRSWFPGGSRIQARIGVTGKQNSRGANRRTACQCAC
jgi:predicted AlkP superfamily pyrophosphatase or phosphodiesterase